MPHLKHLKGPKAIVNEEKCFYLLRKEIEVCKLVFQKLVINAQAQPFTNKVESQLI